MSVYTYMAVWLRIVLVAAPLKLLLVMLNLAAGDLFLSDSASPTRSGSRSRFQPNSVASALPYQPELSMLLRCPDLLPIPAAVVSLRRLGGLSISSPGCGCPGPACGLVSPSRLRFTSLMVVGCGYAPVASAW